MAKRNVTIYTDDRDGSDLDGEPDSIYLAFRDQSWNLNLTDRNLAELEKTIADFTRHAEPVRGRSRSSSAPKEAVNRYDVPVKEVRRWAQNEGKTFVETAGLSVPGKRGRVDERVHELHDKHA